MVLHYKTEGLVFKREDSFDADRNFSIFTKDFGRLEVFGKAIRKINSKLRGGIELFSICDIEFIQGRNKKTLTDANFLKRFKNIFSSLIMLETAHRISQLADNFIKGEGPDEQVWGLLVDAFEKLNHYQLQENQCQLVYNYFFWNFVSVLGYKPELSSCANCSQKLNPYELYFSNREGGVICKNCYLSKKDSSDRSGQAIKVKSDIIKVLRLILNKDWDLLSRLKIEDGVEKSLQEVSDNYYSYLKSNLTANLIG